MSKVTQETRPPAPFAISGSPSQPRPTVLRTDSRSSFPQQINPAGPQQNFQQIRPSPQLPPGVNPQQQPRPFNHLPRNVGPPQNLGPQQPVQRPIGPPRPSGPNSFAPLVSRPQPPLLNTNVQRPLPPPQTQPFGPRPVQVERNISIENIYLAQQPASLIDPGKIINANGVKQSQNSQHIESRTNNLPNNREEKQFNSNQPKVPNTNMNSETMNILGTPKSRSYSIAAPAETNLLKTEDDRRKSISTVGSNMSESVTKQPGLGFIKEDPAHDKRTEVMQPAHTNARLPMSMTDSFMAAPKPEPKKKDDNDDVILQNTPTNMKSDIERPNVHANLNTSMETGKQENKNITPSNTYPSTQSYNISHHTAAKDNTAAGFSVNKPANQAVTEKCSPQSMERKQSESIYDQLRAPPRKLVSAPKERMKDGDNDSGVDESTQGNDVNGSPGSPKKTPSKLPIKEKSNGNLKQSLSRSSSKSATARTPENPPVAEKKKVPMNKIQVGNAPSPNIKAVRSKIGSLDNATYKPGGGKVKIENKKIDFQNVTPRIAAKNETYIPSGGSKKITTTKLEWNAKSKIGSLQNAAYKPGGGDKKIETVKLDFKDKAKPKVASTVNITHKPGGGDIKIEHVKLEFKAQSKVGSMDNVKHKPKGGDVKIFDDKEYIKQMVGHSPALASSNHSRQESPLPPQNAAHQQKPDENSNQSQP